MNNTLITTLAAFLLLHLTAFPQETGIMQQMKQDEQDAVEAIALYPEKERNAILIAAANPEILVRMQHLQRKSESDFQDLLGPMHESEQKVLFNLARYPDLVQKITAGGKRKSNKEMEAITAGYPDEVKNQAITVNKENFSQLASINNMYQSFNNAFENLIDGYPVATKNAYRELLKLPEVLEILTDNMSTTVLLGDLYKRQPEQLKLELDSLNKVVAEQKAKELNDWKEELEKNPQAMNEFEQESKEFAAQQGYDDTDYGSPLPQNYTTTTVYVQHVWQPYPYWFGYPWWYSYPCWYPYPWWYHWGYYYGPGNVIVFIGLPSYYYVNWHFHHHRHFYRYPHYTNQMVNHYYGHRNTSSSVSRGVSMWEHQLSNELPKDWLANDVDRVNRIKEYGEFKDAYDQKVISSRGIPPSEKEFLQSNAAKYPTLKGVLKDTPQTTSKPDYYPEKAQPAVTMPQKSNEVYKPKPKVIENKQPEYREINRARDYHENKWEINRPQPRTTPRQAPRTVTPVPSRQPSRPATPVKPQPVKPVKPTPVRQTPVQQVPKANTVTPRKIK